VERVLPYWLCRRRRKGKQNLKLFVRPVFLPKVVLTGMMVCSVSRLIEAWALRHNDHNGDKFKPNLGGHRALMLEMIVAGPAILLINVVMWWWASHQERVQERVQNFRICEATCLSEDDRQIVEGNVALFTAYFEFIEPGSTKAQALEAFDKVVHQEVPQVIKKSMGRVGIPYKYAVAIFGMFLMETFDLIAGRIANPSPYGKDWRIVPAWTRLSDEGLIITLHLTFCFAHYPLIIAIASICARWGLLCRGSRATFYSAFVASGVAICIVVVTANNVLRYLVVLAVYEKKQWATLSFWAWVLMAGIITCYVYRPVHLKPVCVPERLAQATARGFRPDFTSTDESGGDSCDETEESSDTSDEDEDGQGEEHARMEDCAVQVGSGDVSRLYEDVTLRTSENV